MIKPRMTLAVALLATAGLSMGVSLLGSSPARAECPTDCPQSDIDPNTGCCKPKDAPPKKKAKKKTTKDSEKQVKPTETPKAEGEQGGACYGNGTCNVSLECRSNKCVMTGGEGQPCTSGGACGSHLECRSDLCQPIKQGTQGGACYGNGTCDPTLTCSSGTCLDPRPQWEQDIKAAAALGDGDFKTTWELVDDTGSFQEEERVSVTITYQVNRCSVWLEVFEKSEIRARYVNSEGNWDDWILHRYETTTSGTVSLPQSQIDNFVHTTPEEPLTVLAKNYYQGSLQEETTYTEHSAHLTSFGRGNADFVAALKRLHAVCAKAI